MSKKEKKEKVQSTTKQKDKKYARLLVLAVILAIGAGVGVFFSIRSQKATIYEFNGQYAAGTQVTANMLTPVEVDKTIVIGGEKSSVNSRFVTAGEIDEVLNSADKLRMDVGKGAFLTESTLVEKGGNQIENILTSTGVAVTVDVDSETGVTDDLRAGSFVNVYMRVAGKLNVIEGLKVISVQTDKNKGITSATLECDFEQSKVIAQAADEGSIRFGLTASGYQKAQ